MAPQKRLKFPTSRSAAFNRVSPGRWASPDWCVSPAPRLALVDTSAGPELRRYGPEFCRLTSLKGARLRRVAAFPPHQRPSRNWGVREETRGWRITHTCGLVLALWRPTTLQNESSSLRTHNSPLAVHISAARRCTDAQKRWEGGERHIYICGAAARRRMKRRVFLGGLFAPFSWCVCVHCLGNWLIVYKIRGARWIGLLGP